MNDQNVLILVVGTALVGICFAIRDNLRAERDRVDTFIKNNKDFIENEPLASTTEQNKTATAANLSAGDTPPAQVSTTSGVSGNDETIVFHWHEGTTNQELFVPDWQTVCIYGDKVVKTLSNLNVFLDCVVTPVYGGLLGFFLLSQLGHQPLLRDQMIIVGGGVFSSIIFKMETIHKKWAGRHHLVSRLVANKE